MRVRAIGLCCLMLSAAALPVLAATPRSVTIVVEQNGAPVADARVLIAADEMDAVGRTDAQGRVTVTTTSTRISVLADKGAAKGSVEGTGTELTVVLSGGSQ